MAKVRHLSSLFATLKGDQMNATEAHAAMIRAIRAGSRQRATTDRSSPTQQLTLEASPGHTFTLKDPAHNLVRSRSVDLRWAVANVLHFFACTEEAGTLRRYCEHADRFLTGDKWFGAYGYTFLPGIKACVEHLRGSPSSRRAVAAVGDLSNMDINRPPCWNVIHFLRDETSVDMLVYQRSLSMSVMPYDCVLLTNVLSYVATALETRQGSLVWAVGSLHSSGELKCREQSPADALSVTLPFDTLDDAELCQLVLEDPAGWRCFPFSDWLVKGARS